MYPAFLLHIIFQGLEIMNKSELINVGDDWIVTLLNFSGNDGLGKDHQWKPMILSRFCRRTF